MKMCSPPKQEAHFRKPNFANIVCKATFPFPKRLQNHHFGRGISVLCCSTNKSFRRLSGKWPSWEALFNIACIFACILEQIFTFSLLILSLLWEALFNVTCTLACMWDRLFMFSLLLLSSLVKNAPRLVAKHGPFPSRKKYLMMIASNNRRLSIACPSSHIRTRCRRLALPKPPRTSYVSSHAPQSDL